MTTSLAAVGFASEIAVAQSPIGVVAVAVVDQRVAATSVGHRDARRAQRALERMVRTSSRRRREAGNRVGAAIQPPCPDACPCPDAEQIVESLVRYAQGRRVEFGALPIEDRHLTPFQRRVVEVCRAIPFGETRTYGELARLAGCPGAARAVGQVMSGNRAALIVPCHRVVASSGKLGGFSAPQGVSLKRQLLELERSVVDEGCGAA